MKRIHTHSAYYLVVLFSFRNPVVHPTKGNSGWALRSPLPSKIDEEQHGPLLYPATPTTPHTLNTHHWPRRCAPWLRVNRSSSLCNFRVTWYKCGSPQTYAAHTLPLTQLGHHWLPRVACGIYAFNVCRSGASYTFSLPVFSLDTLNAHFDMRCGK
ncbi:hypothetical protein E2C01_059960 [Portunus trituberculatus]|uniref:Uncharacterized protein n=1 Tax=Portunus trituberculatus TaxID=210409 RepID=A0A5B7HAP9_PORTR|nr:hypothetical protein [Portunus trituberculatus]